MKQLAIALMLGMYSISALAISAVGPVALPEPGALSLVAIGALGGLVIWMRNRK